MYSALAEQIIREQFAGHTDKGGRPYIGHLLRVRATVAEQGGDDICQSIALLHDLLEDTDYPPEELARQFPPRVTEAVVALTKIPGEAYPEYLQRIAQFPDAVRVKLADLQDNMDLSRLSQVTDRDRERLEKYQSAVVFLRNVPPIPDRRTI